MLYVEMEYVWVVYKESMSKSTFRKMDLYLYALFWCSIDIVIFILLSEERKMPSERIYIKELHNLFLVHSFLLLFCDIKNLMAMLM